MKPARPIAPWFAPWLAAVIVMVAAVLMPSGARAHGGHPHEARMPSVVVTVAGLEGATSNLSRRTDAAILSQAAVAPARLACACVGCMVGAACGHASSSCCATGLAPSLVPALIAPVEGGRAGMPDEPHLSGIVPEAQTEPPKPIA